MARTKTQAETDRTVLDGTRGITEALCRLGKFSDAELGEMARDREAVGAKPLDLGSRRDFDESALTPVREFTPDAVRELREREGASQAVFAKHLGVAVQTVGQWERGKRKPDGAAAKLLALAQTHGLPYIR